MSLYSMLVRILNEALSVCYSKRKKQVKLRAGGLESVYISVKGRVRFKGNLFRFLCFSPGAGYCLQWRGVCNSIVSLSTLAKDGIESACGKNTQ